MFSKERVEAFISRNSIEGAGYQEFLFQMVESQEEIGVGRESFKPAIYALFYACENNNLDFVNNLLSADVILGNVLHCLENQYFAGGNLFHSAAKVGSVKLAEKLIDLGWDRNLQGREQKTQYIMRLQMIDCRWLNFYWKVIMLLLIVNMKKGEDHCILLFCAILHK